MRVRNNVAASLKSIGARTEEVGSVEYKDRRACTASGPLRRANFVATRFPSWRIYTMFPLQQAALMSDKIREWEEKEGGEREKASFNQYYVENEKAVLCER